MTTNNRRRCRDTGTVLADSSEQHREPSPAYIGITIAVMAFIFIHSAMPGEISGAESNVFVNLISMITGLEADSLGLIVRKLAHFTEFAVLGGCLLVNVRDWAQAHDKVITAAECCIIAWMIGTVYAVTDEVHQMFVPDRAYAFTDVCIDSAGVLFGAIVISVILSIRRKPEDQ